MSMTMRVGTFVALLVTLASTNAYPDNCAWCHIEMDNKVGQIEAKVVILESRMMSQQEAYSNEMTSLHKDAEGIKTAVIRVAGDNEVTNRSVNRLMGLDRDVASLRSKVTEVKKHMDDSVDHVHLELDKARSNFENEKRAQAGVINLLQNQLAEVKTTYDKVNSELTEQTNKLGDLQTRVAKLAESPGSGSNSGTAALQNSLTELQNAFDQFKRDSEERIGALHNSIDDIRREAKVNQFYPNRG